MPWSIVTNSSPPTRPANDTVPVSGARIGVPNATAMSIPRWPAPNGDVGGSNARITGPVTGQDQVELASGDPAPAIGPRGGSEGRSAEADGPITISNRGRTNAWSPTPVLRSS